MVSLMLHLTPCNSSHETSHNNKIQHSIAQDKAVTPGLKPNLPWDHVGLELVWLYVIHLG